MKTYHYIVREFNPQHKNLNGKIVAIVLSENERSAWLSVLQFAKERNMTVKVFTNSDDCHGIVHPDGQTQSLFCDY